MCIWNVVVQLCNAKLSVLVKYWMWNQEEALVLGSRGEPLCGPSFEALMHTVTVISLGPIMMVGWLVSMTMTASSTLTTRNKAPSFVG